jgi:hypothetical protein
MSPFVSRRNPTYELTTSHSNIHLKNIPIRSLAPPSYLFHCGFTATFPLLEHFILRKLLELIIAREVTNLSIQCALLSHCFPSITYKYHSQPYAFCHKNKLRGL